jgi:hypothetical protein
MYSSSSCEESNRSMNEGQEYESERRTGWKRERRRLMRVRKTKNRNLIIVKYPQSSMCTFTICDKFHPHTHTHTHTKFLTQRFSQVFAIFGNEFSSPQLK